MNALPEPALEHGAENEIEEHQLRASPRFTPLIQAAKMVTEHGEYLCVVCDASADGMKIRHLGNLPEQDSFAIELANGERIAACVVWQDEVYAGLRFFEGVERPKLTCLTEDGPLNGQIRLSANPEATLSWDDGKTRAVVEAMSRRGVSVRCDYSFAIDQTLRFKLGSNPEQFARVRWRNDNRYALVFENMLTLEQLATAIASLNTRA